ncbi:MAG: hypothetical protein U0V74_07425 [Chitinophagales bacterium]
MRLFYLSGMITYRVQFSDTFGWIIRHPDVIYPEFHHKDKEVVIARLDEHFKKRKQHVTVQICDDFGRTLEVKEYPYQSSK